jgi:hypothetical protein
VTHCVAWKNVAFACVLADYGPDRLDGFDRASVEL